MNMEIDKAAYNAYRNEELNISTKELSNSSPIKSCLSYHSRLDDGQNQILNDTSENISCSKGCWYCCYYKVDVWAEEVFLILDYVRKSLPANFIGKLRNETAENSSRLKKMTHSEKLVANIKCPFLIDSKCSIYKVRPEKCRTFHAKGVEGCKQSYETPEIEVPMSMSSPLFTHNQGLSDGRSEAIIKSGFDRTVYELNIALNIALSNNKYRKRYEKKKKAFPNSNSNNF